MKLVLMLIAFAAAGCLKVGVPKNVDCVTRCGIFMDDRTPAVVERGWSCENVQKWEDDYISLFPKLVKQTPTINGGKPVTSEEVCSLIGKQHGVIVFVQNMSTWMSAGESVSGQTYCDWHHVLVAVSFNPWQSNLTHEMNHWMQRCHWDKPAVEAAALDIRERYRLCLEVAVTRSGVEDCESVAQEKAAELGQLGFHAHWEELGLEALDKAMSNLAEKRVEQ